MGSHEPDEDTPALCARRTAVAQIGGDGGADVGGDWQTLSSGSLAVHDDLADTPIEITKLEGGDFGRAQSEPREQRQDREIPASSGRPAITGCEQAPEVARFHALRQPRQSPSGHRGRGRDQRVCDRALDMKKAQERSQRAHGQLRGVMRLMRRVSHHERDHVSGAEMRDIQIETARREPRGQKRANRAGYPRAVAAPSPRSMVRYCW